MSETTQDAWVPMPSEEEIHSLDSETRAQFAALARRHFALSRELDDSLRALFGRA